MLKRLAILVGTLMTPFMVHAALVDTPEWSGSLSGLTELGGLIQDGGPASPPKFFSGAGELKKAKFTFFVSAEGSLSGDTGTAEQVDGTVDMVFSINAGGTNLDPFTLSMDFSILIDENNPSFTGFGGGDSFMRTLELPDDAAALVLLTGGFFDTFSLNCSTDTSVNYVSNASIALDFAFATCDARLVYTYEDGNDPDPNPMPEPGTLALVGLAMAGAALTARRRRTA